MAIYLDNSATTMVYPQVGETVKNLMCAEFGNPSSMQLMGAQAERVVKESARKLAALL